MGFDMKRAEGKTMVELKIRCDPKVKKQLDRESAKRPHLSMNAFLNEIIIEKLDALAGAKK
jgi:predicted HicB family RNase H-like nuclease